jgi:hypothetical protein
VFSLPEGVGRMSSPSSAGTDLLDRVAGVGPQELLVEGGQMGEGLERATITGGQISRRVHEEKGTPSHVTQAAAVAAKGFGPHDDAHFLGNG